MYRGLPGVLSAMASLECGWAIHYCQCCSMLYLVCIQCVYMCVPGLYTVCVCVHLVGIQHVCMCVHNTQWNGPYKVLLFRVNFSRILILC